MVYAENSEDYALYFQLFPDRQSAAQDGPAPTGNLVRAAPPRSTVRSSAPTAPAAPAPIRGQTGDQQGGGGTLIDPRGAESCQ